jgi:hypothetical protein
MTRRTAKYRQRAEMTTYMSSKSTVIVPTFEDQWKPFQHERIVYGIYVLRQPKKAVNRTSPDGKLEEWYLPALYVALRG